MSGMIQVPYGYGVITRPAPLMNPSQYRTYGMSMPLKTHWRKATCEEVGCEAYRNGWVSTFDLGTDLGQKQFEYCKNDRSRSFSYQRTSLTLVKFVYAPGNRCFRSGDHRVPLERPTTFIVYNGDFRARTGEVRVHKRAEDWVEDFAEHQDRIATAIGRG